MITDAETNKLFLAGCLQTKHPIFYERLKNLLTKKTISFSALPSCLDIWVRDFMPVQVTTKKFIQFMYEPDYLKPKKYRHTISNADLICDSIALTRIKSNIILDGGNVMKARNKVILCDKLFFENPHIERKKLIQKLYALFETDEIYFVPQQPNDITGHVDGMLRFVDEDTVLINDYSRENKTFQRAFRIALDNAKLNYVEIPYNLYQNNHVEDATGTYINFLQMENLIVVPVFDLKEDDIVVKQLQTIFENKIIETINCCEIARSGGVLNCISWNIQS